jgi:hypothetical protein
VRDEVEDVGVADGELTDLHAWTVTRSAPGSAQPRRTARTVSPHGGAGPYEGD